ncbi:MAG: T9SS type A sorting domain-containing protein [Bacteroidia bacterium]
MKKAQKLIQATLLVISLFFAGKNLSAQTISPHFFGQNAWMPDTIGNAAACTEPPCILYGKLHRHWADVKNSGATLIRYGGIAVDKNMPTNYQYIRMIDSIRANGMEPIIQVPFRMNRYNEQQAADIVKFINVTSGKNIKYWVIGNEPDLGYSYSNGAQIAAYIKPFASAMKNVDPSIFIIGPECAWFNQQIITDITTPNGPYDITGKDAYGHYYVDYISFHTYPFSGSQTRAQVISKLSSAGSLQDNLAYLNTRVASCNTTHGRNGSSALKTAITEANIDYQNSSADNLYGVGASSFIGGQFWAEMMAVAMKNGVDFINFWSVAEGNNVAANIGYIDAGSNTKKPSYYHFQLMAQNFKGNYVNGTTNQANVKSFGSQNSQQTVVMVLNQDLTNNYNCTIRLNTAAISGTSQLKINVNANIAIEHTEVIASQSTVLFVFNSSGALIKKYEYSLDQNAVANVGPTLTEYNGTTGVEPIKSLAHEGKYFEIAKVFPNPNTGKFTIQLNKENVDEVKYQIEVFNMEGQTALTKTDAPFVKGKEEVDLTMGTLAAGVYIVRVRLGEDMKTAKVVMVK